MKILIVDDSALDRRLLTKILTKAEVTQEILEAEDGEKALEVMAQNHQDICLVLLDWQMPRMSGIEVLAGIAKIPVLSSIPVIMVSASGSEENKRQAGEANPNLAGYIVKPYKTQVLLEAIKPYLK